MRKNEAFRFKQFSINHDRCAHRVGTDGVLIGAWIEAESPQQILDVGTGSSLIALMLAQRFPEAKVTGIELDSDSAQQATENAASSPFAGRVQIIQADFLHFTFAKKYDLIVSNPPFFKGVYSSGSEKRDKARHEFSLPQKNFILRTVQLLNPEGKIALILPKEEGQNFINLAKSYNLHLQRLTKVYGSPSAEDKRWLMEFGFASAEAECGTLVLRDANGTLSTVHKKLTGNFYLD